MAGVAGESPAIFNDKAWKLDFRLSTSQTPVQRGPGGGFGPVCAEGYGLSYIVKEENLFFHISSWRGHSTDTSKFAQAIEQALLDVQTLCTRKARMARNNSEKALNLLF